MELKDQIHEIDKKQAAYHAANDERWAHTQKILGTLVDDVVQVKEAVVGIKAKIAGFVTVCTVVAYGCLELIKLVTGR